MKEGREEEGYEGRWVGGRRWVGRYEGSGNEREGERTTEGRKKRRGRNPEGVKERRSEGAKEGRRLHTSNFFFSDLSPRSFNCVSTRLLVGMGELGELMCVRGVEFMSRIGDEDHEWRVVSQCKCGEE